MNELEETVKTMLRNVMNIMSNLIPTRGIHDA